MFYDTNIAWVCGFETYILVAIINSLIYNSPYKKLHPTLPPSGPTPTLPVLYQMRLPS